MSPRTSRVQPGKGSEPVPVAKPVVRRRKATVYDAVAGYYPHNGIESIPIT